MGFIEGIWNLMLFGVGLIAAFWLGSIAIGLASAAFMFVISLIGAAFDKILGPSRKD